MKKIYFALFLLTTILHLSTSCDKEIESDSVVCGKDSCLAKECSNHPADIWVYEHCYDFSLRDADCFLCDRKYYYRENQREMDIDEDVFILFYGKFNKTIINEYDIWNKREN